ISFLYWVIVIYPHAATTVAFTNELTHTEFHHRLAGRIHAVPAWFDEGLAVNVSADPRYLGPIRSGEPCVVDASTALPVNDTAWVRATQVTNKPYAEAACLVSNWLGEKGGKDAVLRLVGKIRAGESFAKAAR